MSLNRQSPQSFSARRRLDVVPPFACDPIFHPGRRIDDRRITAYWSACARGHVHDLGGPEVDVKSELHDTPRRNAVMSPSWLQGPVGVRLMYTGWRSRSTLSPTGTCTPRQQTARRRRLPMRSVDISGSWAVDGPQASSASVMRSKIVARPMEACGQSDGTAARDPVVLLGSRPARRLYR